MTHRQSKPQSMTHTQSEPLAQTRWAIRVTYPSGQEAFLRHGVTAREGAIVTFKTRRDAELNAESMVKPGLDDGCVVAIVRVAKHSKWKDE